jgi:hypothetical protein
MSHLNSEVLINYANAMEEKYGIDKYAWTSRDLTKALALEGIVAGSIAGVGAAGVGTGGATGLTGALTALVPVGGAGVAGAGGLGAAIVSNPIGWIVGAVLLVGGVAAAIYYGTKMADDNIRDLITRIEALDYEGTIVETRVQSWIDTLNGKLQVMQLPALGAMSDKEKAMQLAQKVMEIEDLVKILNEIASQWSETKKHLGDWQFFPFDDPADFEEAFEKTYKTCNNVLNKIKQQSQSAAKQVIESTKNPDLLMTEIKSLDYQITQIWGKPEYTAEEAKTLGVGERMMKRQVNMKEYSDNLPRLVAIRDDLKRLLPKAKRMSGKVALMESKQISKRAVKLPDKPSAPGIKPRVPSSRRTKPRIQKSDTVANMQRQVNDLATALDIPLDARLKEDGIYGPKTARAVADLVGKLATEADPKKAPEQAKIYGHLKRWGIVGNTIMNVELMRSTPRYMNVLTNAVDNIYQLHTGMRQRPISTRDQQQQQQHQQQRTPAPDAWSKQYANKQEILQELGKTYAMIGGTRTNLYDYARSALGLNDDQIYRLIKAEFGDMAPENWSIPNLVEALGSRHSALY